MNGKRLVYELQQGFEFCAENIIILFMARNRQSGDDNPKAAIFITDY
jgi:hypothetical protein